MKRRITIHIVCILAAFLIVISYNMYHEYNNRQIKLAVVRDNSRKEWYGAGSGYEYEAYVNGENNRLKHIDMIEEAVLVTMNQWKDEGIQSITGWRQEEVDKIIANIEDMRGFDEETANLSIQILKNNYNVLDDSYINEEGKKVYVHFDDFIEAVMRINQNDYGAQSDLHSKFNEKIADNRKQLKRKGSSS